MGHATKLKHKLVMVTWVDAQSSPDWDTYEKIMKWGDEDCEITEIGWEVGETKNYLILSSQVCKDGDWGNRTKIPTKWIIGKKVINERPIQKPSRTRPIQNARKRPKRT